MPTDNLVSCPTCHTAGFTPRGLKAHRCDGKNRNALVPSVPSVLSTDDATLAAQLREQYGRAHHWHFAAQS